jgi:dTDP-4-amino-4,6-dideoxygalactose transaminase
MIQYYNPNFTVKSFLSSLFEKNPEEKIINHFKEYTSKKYILVTGSCRSALFLSYIAAGITGKKIATTPLTCFSALHPVLLADNEIEFVDIDDKSLNMDVSLLTDDLLDRISAVQFIHHGGIPINYLDLKEKLKRKNIIIIEDCAQAYGAKYDGENVGSAADISCFSLIKNLFGIGGGILATDNYYIYESARKYQNTLPKVGFNLAVFRIFRNILDTYRKYGLMEYIYTILMKLRPDRNDFEITKNKNNYIRQNRIILNINSVQLNKVSTLNFINKKSALKTVKLLEEKNILYNNLYNEDCSFAKLFIYNPKFNSEKIIRKMNKLGIEAKHLEQKYNSYYQERFDKLKVFYKNESIKNCRKYISIHDSVISVPVKIDEYTLISLINSLISA